MSHNGDVEGEEYFSMTPKWDNFSAKMKHVLDQTKKETDAAEVTLTGDHTEIDLRFLKDTMDILKSEFSRYVIQYNSITSEEYVEDDSNLYSDLRGAMNCITLLLYKINAK